MQRAALTRLLLSLDGSALRHVFAMPSACKTRSLIPDMPVCRFPALTGDATAQTTTVIEAWLR
jgi:hypothetical protein